MLPRPALWLSQRNNSVSSRSKAKVGGANAIAKILVLWTLNSRQKYSLYSVHYPRHLGTI